MATSRKRDYAAERRRRNQLARERGYTSLDALAKARRKGEFPTARAIRTNPAERERAAAVSAERVPKLLGAKDAKELKSWNMLSKKWSKSHGRQDGTIFDDRWSDEQKADYYNAFVRWWRVHHDERNFEPTYYYMQKYGGFGDIPYDENPYSS